MSPLLSSSSSAAASVDLRRLLPSGSLYQYDGLSPAMRCAVRGLLHPDPRKRLTVDELLMCTTTDSSNYGAAATRTFAKQKQRRSSSSDGDDNFGLNRSDYKKDGKISFEDSDDDDAADDDDPRAYGRCEQLMPLFPSYFPALYEYFERLARCKQIRDAAALSSGVLPPHPSSSKDDNEKGKGKEDAGAKETATARFAEGLRCSEWRRDRATAASRLEELVVSFEALPALVSVAGGLQQQQQQQ